MGPNQNQGLLSLSEGRDWTQKYRGGHEWTGAGIGAMERKDKPATTRTELEAAGRVLSRRVQ